MGVIRSPLQVLIALLFPWTRRTLTGRTFTKSTTQSATTTTKIGELLRAENPASRTNGVVVRSGTCGTTEATGNGKTMSLRVQVMEC